MILKRLNPKASEDNALKFTNLDGLCCGDKAAAIVCSYTATISGISGTTAVDQVNIGGTTYTLDGAYLVNQERERDALVDNIVRIIRELGYDGKGNVIQSFESSTLTITTEYSDLEFGWLEADTNPFVPTACKFVGEPNTGTCDVGVSLNPGEDDTFVIKIYSTGALASATVNDGGSVYSGNLADGTTGNATVTTESDGTKVITIDVGSGGENWAAVITLTVTVTQTACDVFTRVAKFDYS